MKTKLSSSALFFSVIALSVLTLNGCSNETAPSSTGLQGGIVNALKNEPERSANTTDRNVAATSSSASVSSMATSSVPSTNAKTLPKIELDVKSIGGVTTWVLKNKKVKAGQSYLLVAKNDLKTGPEFHGLTIKDFGIATQVNRGKEYSAVVDIPADKKGEVLITCQFHPKHMRAVLTVE